MDAITALRELLRLYDWRNELAAIALKNAPHDAASAKQMKKWLNQYGREKKAAWAVAREVLNALKDRGSSP